MSSAATVTDQFIELNGLRFHFRDWESAKAGAQDLVILPGTSQTARAWDAIAEAICADYRVLVLDHRGHGESQWAAPDQYGLDPMVSDLEAFVAALGLQRFVLLGHSMGGNVGFGYAGKRPPELERFIIEDVAPDIAEAGLARVLTMFKSRDVFDSAEEVVARMVAAAPSADPAAVRQRALHNIMRTADGKWTWRWDRAFRDPARPFPPLRPPAEGWALVANIEVPTLLIRGAASDILAADVAAKMVATIPDCRLIEVAGAGHGVHTDQPAAFLEAIRTFA